RLPPHPPLPYTTLFQSPEDFGGNAVEVIDQSGHVRAASYSVTPDARVLAVAAGTRGGFFRDITARNPVGEVHLRELVVPVPGLLDRKSTRLNSSHRTIS